MLATLGIRLGMVAFTLAVVCWIGWSVPESGTSQPPREAELQASLPRSPEGLLSLTPQAVPPRPLQGRENKAMPRRESTVDLNRATKEDLERLPGIGPVLAGRIVEYRSAQGKFDDVEQLRHVKGIGKKKFEQIRPHVAVLRPALPKPSRKTA